MQTYSYKIKINRRDVSSTSDAFLLAELDQWKPMRELMTTHIFTVFY